jgi:hypothetical protein
MDENDLSAAGAQLISVNLEDKPQRHRAARVDPASSACWAPTTIGRIRFPVSPPATMRVHAARRTLIPRRRCRFAAIALPRPLSRNQDQH